MHESVHYYVDRLEVGAQLVRPQDDANHYTYANRAVTLKPLDVSERRRRRAAGESGEVMVASLVTL